MFSFFCKFLSFIFFVFTLCLSTSYASFKAKIHFVPTCLIKLLNVMLLKITQLSYILLKNSLVVFIFKRVYEIFVYFHQQSKKNVLQSYSSPCLLKFVPQSSISKMYCHSTYCIWSDYPPHYCHCRHQSLNAFMSRKTC
jgi:hypothetical protein